ncbi:MAG: hypothetical protein IJY39_10460 [Clostridia bacterium]|nr:hypothetical protein [Clostridia bacterium]
MDNNQNNLTDEIVVAEQPKADPPVGEAVKTMVFGIIAVQFSMIPFFGIIGIIFGALAKKWAVPIIKNYPYTGARLFAKAGQITGKIGFILGIVFTVFWVLYFILIGALIGLGLASEALI